MAEAAKSLQALKYPRRYRITEVFISFPPLFHNILKIRKAGMGCYNHDSVIFLYAVITCRDNNFAVSVDEADEQMLFEL